MGPPPSGGGGGGSSCTETDTADNACGNDGSDYSYTETLDADLRTITTSHCPNHKWISLNPNYPYIGSRTYKIPIRPNLMDSDTTSLVRFSPHSLTYSILTRTLHSNIKTQQGGGVGVLLNGAMIYSAFAGGDSLATDYSNDYSNSAPALEGNTFDFSGQHGASTTSASWHAHVAPSLLLAQLNAKNDETSPQLGWMFDGFPVYGPRGPDGVMLTRCSESSPSTPCLDECNGLSGSWTLSDGTTDGYNYRYFITGPYV